MFDLQDFLKMKEQNEQVIKENNAIICEKQKTNVELEAENRVFDKLIAVANASQDAENI